MAFLDDLARGINVDPAGGFLRTTLQGRQMQQQQQESQLRGLLLQAKLAETFGAIQTQQQANAALRQMADELMPLADQIADPRMRKFVQARLGSNNLPQKAEGLRQLGEALGPEPIVGTVTLGGEEPGVYGRTAFGLGPRLGDAPPKTGQTINVSTADGMQGALAKGDIEEFNEVSRESARMSRVGLLQVAQARRLLKTAKTGQLAELQETFGKTLQFFNMDPAAVGISVQQLASNAGLRRLTMMLAAEAMAQQKGPISDREFGAIMAATVNISNTPEGNQQILDLVEESLRFNRDMVRRQRNYLEKNKSLSGWLELEDELVDQFIAEKTAPPGSK